MPRYDDRHGNTRLYVGRISYRTRSRDLEDLFSRYGRVRNVDMKRDFAFVEFSDPRDADDARHSLDGREFDGSRIIVEFARGGPRGPGGSRDYAGRGPPPGSGRCFNCGIDGHWARDCKAGDWKNRCYRCGEGGHVERNCQNSPRNLRRGRSYSRSPSRRGRSRSRSYSRSCSYSRSRSPAREGRGVDRENGWRSRSPQYSRSPRKSPPLKERKHSPSPDVSRSPKGRMSPPLKEEAEPNGSDYDQSPRRGNSRSPMSQERESPRSRRYRSPPPKEEAELNIADYDQSPRRGNSRSPMNQERESPRRGNSRSRSRSPMSQERESPRSRRYGSPAANGGSPSPRDYTGDNKRYASPRGSESPPS
ncbi:unnamed protein product [Musa textilis]